MATLWMGSPRIKTRRSLFLLLAAALAGGCTSLPTREAGLREHKVALDADRPVAPAVLTEVGTGPGDAP